MKMIIYSFFILIEIILINLFNSTHKRFVVTEWNENLGLDDEELQIYKTPYSEIYELHNHRSS